LRSLAIVIAITACSRPPALRGEPAECRADEIGEALLDRIESACSADAAREPGRGGIRRDACGRYRVRGDSLRLHHAFTAAECALPSPIPQRFHWWSPTDPARVGLRCYRRVAVLCDEWGSYDCVLHCTVRQGALVEIGPGNGVACEAGARPGSAAPQVYLSNPDAALANCSVERNHD
jgi:hypothetical protein